MPRRAKRTYPTSHGSERSIAKRTQSISFNFVHVVRTCENDDEKLHDDGCYMPAIENKHYEFDRARTVANFMHLTNRFFVSLFSIFLFFDNTTMLQRGQQAQYDAVVRAGCASINLLLDLLTVKPLSAL